MGLPDYLGWNWKSKAGIPIVNIPGCPAQPDNITETLMYLVLRARRAWRRCPTSTRRCGRSGCSGAPRARAATAPASTEQGNFATEYGSDHRCLVKLGCKGPVVKCNVPLRGWINGIGGCPNVGGICMACTMPGFPDKYMPFMDEDRWGGVGGDDREGSRYGPVLRYVRNRHITQRSYDKEPEWRHNRGASCTTGYHEALVRGADMATAETPARAEGRRQGDVVGSGHPDRRAASGIHTEIDFANQQVLKCYSTSMIFRGFDIFMKGIDPRDAHFITSRICGICGDNHCTCSCLNQNMAYGVKPPPLGDYAFNLAESADFMFDHAIFNDCMANVDYSEQVVKETNPALLKKAEETSAPHADIHGYKTIADIMRALNAFTGELLPRDAAGGALHARDVLPVRRPPHAPLDDHAGRLQRRHHAPDADRLLRAPDALHGLLQAHGADARRPLRLLLRGAAGVRRGRLPRHRPRLLGRVRRPGLRRLRLPQHDRVGPAAVRHAGPRVQGRADHTDLVEINLAIRILLGSSYFDDWTERGDASSRTTRSATRSTSATRGTR